MLLWSPTNLFICYPCEFLIRASVVYLWPQYDTLKSNVVKGARALNLALKSCVGLIGSASEVESLERKGCVNIKKKESGSL